ncbi:tetratricopeptide repeat protein [Nonomuraea turcica]|uniref:tetratricopeptide repeat protein n=1 Tax=Nonomuraea sp. G32 TaxID=3067274 RepID=UPI00273C53F7|nr:tetratricopeptide repeat protein [Nonomuraea sp. G32]MDP4503987.1 tetratricopeptide repeat protein [Nonomuraea sp. G32]
MCRNEKDGGVSKHADTLTSRSNVADALWESGRLAEAEHRAVLEARRRVLGEEKRSTC